MSGALYIQPHAFFLRLSPEWRVERASANIGEFFAVSAEESLKRPLADLIGEGSVHALRNRLALLRDQDGEVRLPRHRLTATGACYDFAMRFAGHRVLIEAQPSLDHESVDIAGTVRAAIARLPHQPISSLLTEAAGQLRALSGFDAVTIYRRGAIIASNARGNGSLVEAPAPSSALRMIADRDAEPVAFVPPGGERTFLAGATAEERQQLADCGAEAMLCLPIIVDGKTWGLAVCRHHAPRRLTLERLGTAELFIDMVALRMGLAERG